MPPDLPRAVPDPPPGHGRGHDADTVPRLLVTDDRPARVYLARLAPSGRRVQATALNQIAALLAGPDADADTLPWAQVRYRHTQAVRSHLAATYAPATANRMLAALRGVLTEAWRLGQMSAEDLHRATDLAAVRGDRPPTGRHVSAAEITALLAHCSATPGGRRDAALIALLYGTGVRRAEVVALDVRDLDPDEGAVRVASGKGGKHRVVFLPAGAVAAVRAWLEVRGTQPGALFCPVRRGGHPVPGARLSEGSVNFVLRRCADAAGVARFAAHDLRRTAVGDLLDAGVDLATVAQICGHAHPATTARYDRRPASAKHRAADLLQVPFRDPGDPPALRPGS